MEFGIGNQGVVFPGGVGLSLRPCIGTPRSNKSESMSWQVRALFTQPTWSRPGHHITNFCARSLPSLAPVLPDATSHAHPPLAYDILCIGGGKAGPRCRCGDPAGRTSGARGALRSGQGWVGGGPRDSGTPHGRARASTRVSEGPGREAVSAHTPRPAPSGPPASPEAWSL